MEEKHNLGIIRTFLVIFFCFGIIISLVTFFNNWYLSISIIIIVPLIAAIVLDRLYNGVLKQVIFFLRSMNKNDLMIKIDEKIQNSNNEAIKEIRTMFEETKSNFKRQVNIATQISNISEQIKAISRETQSAMEVVAASAEITSRNSEQQLNMLHNASQEAHNIVNTLEKINNEMENTTEFTIDSINGIQLGIEDTSTVKEKIKVTRDLVKSTKLKVEKLTEYSEDVVKMIDLINSIANQTNMLALNASIEAARAGEHGQGFAVVASEVSKLAKETSEASSKIEEVISTLKTEIANIAQAMEEETIHTEEEYEAIEKTVDNFNKIQENLRSSIEQINLMKDNIKDISKKSIEIQKSVDEVTEFSKDITYQMQETTAQVVLQNEKMISLNKIIEELSNTADEMQQHVTSKVMEGKMLKDVKYILNAAKGKVINDDFINAMIRETGTDSVYISDENGIIRYCNEKESVGVNLYEADKSFYNLKSRKVPYVATPIKKRIEDGKLFKFLAVIDENDIIYQVGLSINSLLNFN